MQLNDAKDRIINLMEQELHDCKSKEQLAQFLFRRFQDGTRTEALAIIDEDWTMFGLTSEEATLLHEECDSHASDDKGSYGDGVVEAEIWEVEEV